MLTVDKSTSKESKDLELICCMKRRANKDFHIFPELEVAFRIRKYMNILHLIASSCIMKKEGVCVIEDIIYYTY